MEDVFFMSKDNLLMTEIKEVLANAGYFCNSAPPTEESWLQVTQDGERFYWDLLADHDNDISMDVGNMEKYFQLEPKVIFCISYHPYAKGVAELKKMLKIVMDKFGGYVACDDDWDVIYTAETVDTLDCTGVDM